jgi:hypothetical protein
MQNFLPPYPKSNVHRGDMDKSERIPGIVQTGKSPMILGEGLLMLSVHCKRQEIL